MWSKMSENRSDIASKHCVQVNIDMFGLAV